MAKADPKVSAACRLARRRTTLRMCHLLFDSWWKASARPSHNAGPAIQADIPNYTNTQPVIQISTVKM
jgi:hypothetical protein